MAFFMDPGAMFLGCLGPSEQKFLVTLIETAAKSGYTRFVEPCAGTFAMANLAVQNGFKPEQIETSDVNMMSTVLGYAITGQSLEPLEIHAQGFSDEELLDPATALYAQLYLRTSKNAGNDYFYQILTDLRLRREMHERGGAAVLVESVVFTEEKMQAMGIPAGTLPIGWWIGFKVTDEDVWEKVKDGTYPMFSIEGEAERVEVEDENTL